jgi:hypothetical protein
MFIAHLIIIILQAASKNHRSKDEYPFPQRLELKLKEPSTPSPVLSISLEEKRKQLAMSTLSPVCKRCWTHPLRQPNDYSTFFMSLF